MIRTFLWFCQSVDRVFQPGKFNRAQFLNQLLVLLAGLLASPGKAQAGMVPKVLDSSGLPDPITPTRLFYVEDYSGPPDSLKKGAGHWRLNVKGQVQQARSYSLQDLQRFPSARQIITLNCIGNPIGGRAMGTALWEGIPLKDFIEKIEPRAFSKTLILRGEDGYYEGIPLSSTNHPGALLAYKMNGEVLTLEHGFPLRLILPGLYGIKQVKWIREMEVSKDSFKGYWNEKGWSAKAKVNLFSRIDYPEHQSWVFSRKLVIKGIAFSGDRGIQYVQVSLDSEKTWSLAKLEPAQSKYSWVFWSFPCEFPGPGRYPIAVRAADQFSGIQRDDARDPFPSGTSGIHRIEILVA